MQACTYTCTPACMHAGMLQCMQAYMMHACLYMYYKDNSILKRGTICWSGFILIWYQLPTWDVQKFNCDGSLESVLSFNSPWLYHHPTWKAKKEKMLKRTGIRSLLIPSDLKLVQVRRKWRVDLDESSQADSHKWNP